MKLIHTLLFLFRRDRLDEDKNLATSCLKSLEKGTYKTVVVYNQGCLTNEELLEFLMPFDLTCIVIGDAENVGTVVGRQSCFAYIWKYFPDTEYISEIHLDMIFTHHWEDDLVDYLMQNDEPLICAGIVDQNGAMSFLNKKIDNVPNNPDLFDLFLMKLREKKIVHGFTNPCIHVSSILKFTGGYNAQFLKGRQCFEDDSMLLGYYYYYGTKANWHPKVNYSSVVYHAIASQRLALQDNVMVNYNGLVKQYGAMGLKHLSQLHRSQWHINFFSEQFNNQ